MNALQKALVHYALSLLVASLDEETVAELNEKFGGDRTAEEWEQEIECHPMF